MQCYICKQKLTGPHVIVHKVGVFFKGILDYFRGVEGQIGLS